VAQFQTGRLLESYRDHNAMLNDAVMDALAYIVETSKPNEEAATEQCNPGVKDKTNIAPRVSGILARSIY